MHSVELHNHAAPRAARAADAENGSIVLQDYRHLGPGGDVHIAISTGPFEIAALTMRDQPEDLDSALEGLVADASSLVGQVDRDGVADIRLAWGSYNQVSLLAFLNHSQGLRKIAGWIEILRQPPDVLRAIFGINKPGGYSLLGRTNMELANDDSAATPAPSPIMTQADAIELCHQPFPGSHGVSTALREAAAIIGLLWSKPVYIGPTSDYSTLSLPALAQLERIWAGAYPAQCGTFRDIFLSLAAKSQNIPAVRAVDLYQGWPAVGDLGFNGHSIVEILDDETQNWIALDTWNAIAFNLQGKFLDAMTMHRIGPGKRATVDLVPLAERCRRVKAFDQEVDREELERVFTLVVMNEGTMLSFFNVVTLGDIISSH